MGDTGPAQIKDFLGPKRILVFDQSTASRKAVFDVLRDLGAETGHLFHANKMANALSIVENERPEIIISEYEIHGQYGLVLLEQAKALIPDLVFILATTTASESSVAEAAEEDVDGYIVKPFVGVKLKHYLSSAFLNRITPPPYTAKINEGKDAITNNDVESARDIFLEALKLGDKPSLAHFYLGQVEESVNLPEKSLEHYDKGLEYVPNHYKCLIAKFQCLDRLKRPVEAYNAVRDMLTHYPITPQRLGRIIYLAMQTKNFYDIFHYYEVYLKLDHKPEKLQVIVKAALFTSGKFLLKNHDYQKAYELFESAVFASKRDPIIISKSIEEMLAHDQDHMAKNLLKLFTQQDIVKPIYKQMDFRIQEYHITKPAILRQGVKLIEEEEADAYIFKRVIGLLKEEGSERLVQKYVDLGNRAFPKEIKLEDI